MMTFQGTPAEIGQAYGGQCKQAILKNLDILVFRKGYEPLPRQDKDFQTWMRGQESLIGKPFPWLLEEMRGVASAVGVEYEDVLLLNLRAWQFDIYGAKPKLGGCSSMAVTLQDGTVALAGALDDPQCYYCGPIRVQPRQGYAFITFPITGTSWVSRGFNSRGLSLGISSQPTFNIPRLDHAINQDLACRAIMQTCATVAEVRDFCRKYPFTMNLVAIDATGGIFGAQHTAAGMFEIPAKGGCALTNHVEDARMKQWMTERKVDITSICGTSVARLEHLRQFIAVRGGKCSLQDVIDLINHRDDANPGTIHNKGSIYLTAANPQKSPNTFWIRQPQATENNTDFVPYQVIES
ncbi:MAG: hypothetical protein IT440_00115 [Phycisphaeraceae bacterium]|nr:hypothetical protein [Phycisphaeraceae bacterium]